MSSETLDLARDIISNYSGRTLKIMEVCGTHTHQIFKYGIRKLLSSDISLISGPGCPVCVTPTGFIDEAVMLALEKNATIATFGDLVRVPGSEQSLALARSKGAKINIVYSPLDAVEYAKNNPDEEVVFLAVGFETTTPSAALAVKNAKEKGISNFSILGANKTMMNAYRMLKDSADAFLYPGHVCAITGLKEYDELKDEGIYGVVTGFTPKEILGALAMTVKKLEKGEAFEENCYKRVVTYEGSPSALKLIEETFDSCDSEWRGLGIIKDSGLCLKKKYSDFDARKKFNLPEITGHPNPHCRCGEVLQGKCTPKDCKVFGKGCTPEHPIGACMVSGEGACSAFYKYGGDF
ncbi:Hydrogenase maturation protein HypD [Acetitomaculum ruminis DSM 5522]|uniref:Hydrogenase maturation protein HypD n=1 Tax=Acetitomaculum ruminis DSM 5522 TaxID=1120918 RepID=A0A1I0Z6N9_9FIRM|nr:hydrogenase formation protein HypD [Acetitomaculum ruminis]SFB21211.1 Hydrogenase maturation protein HypD [Acetitomaculum ruminis DSM 5522]